MQIKDSKDFWAGAMFVGFGLFAVVWSLEHYPLGEAFTIGPGVMPVLVGGLLMAVGAALVVRSFWGDLQLVAQFHWRPLVLLPAATIAYGYLLQPIGLVASTILLVLGSRVAGKDFRWLESLLLGAALGIFSVLVFVLGLKVPVPIWPTMFGGS